MKLTTLCATTGALALLGLSTMAQAQTPLLSATVYADPTETYLDTAESYLVVDFEDSNPAHTYAFGYLYNPSTSPNELTMIRAMQSAVPGFTADPQYYAPFAEYYINGFSYNGLSKDGFVNNGYWSNYNNTSGVFTDSDYTQTSVDQTSLTNGSYDGWAWDTGTGALPVTPLATSVPETSPGWLLLAALPLLWVARRRTQQR